MRILIVTPEFPPHSGGGILKYYALLSDALAQAGASVTVLVATPFSAYDNYTTRDNVSVRFVPLADVEQQAARLSHLSAAPTYRRYIAAALAAAAVVRATADHYDRIETTDFGLLFAPLVTLTNRPPVAVTLHGSIGQISEHEPANPATALDDALARLTEATLLPAADALHAYSPMNAAEWTARLKANVVMQFPPLAVPPIHPRHSSEFSGLVAARIQAWKGPIELCEAVKAMGTGIADDFRIAWAGRDTRSAPDGGSLSQWLTSHYPDIWGTRIVPIGPQPPATIATLQSSVRYVVIPSKWDTFNYTLAESMAARCVTLGSQSAGAAALIDEGTNGFTIDVSDAKQFADRLAHVHALTEQARAAIGDAARQTIVRQLDPSVVASGWLSFLSTLSPQAPPPHVAEWVRQFLDPPSSPHAGEAFLENVSIKRLASHLGQRLVRKASATRS
ncbi:MAG: glycosyltransferase [Acidobacteriaceae bacterium]|jgi:glycosyltransferase involved in cell wall biosynthesis|nr:glycosyltransferase [Acidobacteriaceae bacterium]